MKLLHLLALPLLLLLAGATSLAASPYGLDAPAPAPEPTPAQPRVGFQDLGEDDFLPFPNFRYRTPFVDADEVRLTASKGMAHWAHRYALAAEQGPRPSLATLDAETNRKAVVLDSLNGDSSFQWYRRATDFQDALIRRLEGRDTRKLSFAVRSRDGSRQRHIFVYQAERGPRGVWTCRFYDPHIAPGHPMRTAGELRFLPGYLGFEDDAPATSWVRDEDLPDPGAFQVSAAWARAANDPTGRHPDERASSDTFAEVTAGARFVRLEVTQVGLADAAAHLGWGVEQTTLKLAFRHDPTSYEDGVWDATSDHDNVPEGYQQSWIGRPTPRDAVLLVAVYKKDLPKVLSILGKSVAYSIVRRAAGLVWVNIHDTEGLLTEEERFLLQDLAHRAVDKAASLASGAHQARDLFGGAFGSGDLDPAQDGESNALMVQDPPSSSLPALEGILGFWEQQEVVRLIGSGHAHSKHFPHLDAEQVQALTKDIIENPDAVRTDLDNGRTAFWREADGILVIYDPGRADKGTIFRPDEGRTYFDNLD